MISLEQQQVLANYKHRLPDVFGLFEAHRPLSNFHLEKFYYKDILWPSSENAYQAMKGFPDQYEQVSRLSPKESKRWGKTCRMSDPKWDSKKVDVMMEILIEKYKQCPIAREVLKSTGEHYIEETNFWSDVWWGVYQGKGKNHLGKILMEIRKTLS